jgi:hypothetical protein
MESPASQSLAAIRPEKTGVDKSQAEASTSELEVLPRDKPKVYRAMSDTLSALAATGIVPAAVQILTTHEANAEERFKKVDGERRKALDDLAAMTEAYHEQKELAKTRLVRMNAGYLGSLGQNVLITMGAMCAGAGISETLRVENRFVGMMLLLTGVVLLIVGWGLAIAGRPGKQSKKE